MTIMLLILHIITLLALAFRIMLFTGHGRRRPVIAWLAYAIMVGAFAEAILAATGHSPAPGWPGLVLELALALAIYCHGGNVAELFKTSDRGSRLGKWLCWSPGHSARHQHPHRRKSDRQHNKVTP